MINHNKKNNILPYVKGALIVGISLATLNFVKNNVVPKIPTFTNNLETRLEQSTKLNYIETEKNGEPCVFYNNALYKVTIMNVLPSRGIDDAVQRAGVKYSAEEKYLNSQYNKDHGNDRILQPGDEVYVLKKMTNL